MISILLPVKNGSRYISECIESIKNQSDKDWKLIVINDNSSDDTVQIVNDWIEKDPRISIYNNKGSGIIKALITGLSQSDGTYITRIDHDDLMPETRLEYMRNALNATGAGTIVTGLVKYISDEPVSDGYKKYETWLNKINLEESQWKNIYRECVVASPNWMVRKGDLERSGGFNNLNYPEDYHLVFRWYQNGFSIKCLKETTLLWREHPARTSRNSENYSQEAFFKMKINEFLSFEDKGRELVLWGSGVKGKLTASLLKEKGRQFYWMDLIQKTKNQSRKVIMPYREIENLNKPQLLISVYPNEKKRKKMEAYLEKLGLVKGESYWYL